MKPLMSVLVLLSTLSLVVAAPDAWSKEAGKAGKARKADTAASLATVLWDGWYTITIGGNTPYAYYNERFESKAGRIHYQMRMWKQEEGFINEEQLGAFAEDNSDLTPLFYNFHGNYRSAELMIDGTVLNGKELSVRVKRGQQELPIVKQSLSQRTFFECFFPLWVQRQFASSSSSSPRPGETKSFLTIFEDSLDSNFGQITGRVTIEKPDALTQKTGAIRISAEIGGKKSIWYLEKSGGASRIEFPQLNAVAVKATKAQAESFLKH